MYGLFPELQDFTKKTTFEHNKKLKVKFDF